MGMDYTSITQHRPSHCHHLGVTRAHYHHLRVRKPRAATVTQWIMRKVVHPQPKTKNGKKGKKGKKKEKKATVWFSFSLRCAL